MYRPPIQPAYQQGYYAQSVANVNFPRSFQGKFFNQTHYTHNEEHWCETCDRSFKNKRVLEDHKMQHQKCNIDGCQFIAHPKVITKHIQMQHSTGIYKKLAKLNNPEEVQKWLEERKKKYPTQKNIQKKAAEIKEKIERGEKMGLQRQHRDMPKKTFIQSHESIIPKHNKNVKPLTENKHKCITAKRTMKEKIKEKESNNLFSIPPPISNNKLQPFPGIHALLMNSPVDNEEDKLHTDFIVDDEDDFINTKDNGSLRSDEPKICGVLSSLICNYGSSDEENTNIDNDMKSQSKEKIMLDNIKVVRNVDNNKVDHNADTNKVEHNANTNKVVHNADTNDNALSDDDSGPEEQKIVKTIVNNDNDQKKDDKFSEKMIRPRTNKMQERKNNYHSRSIIRNPRPKRVPSTLLRKLLWKEMRQERNMILQCIRYIVRKKYFDQNNT